MAKKDTLLAVLDGRPTTRFVRPEDTFMVFTPGERNMGGEKQPNGTTIGLDWFGCSWTEPAHPSPIDGPSITIGTQRLDDLEDFRQAIPTPEQVRAFDWTGFFDGALRGYDPEEQVLLIRCMTGFFERMHCLVGFEDALCAFYEEPETVKDYLDAMLEYKMTVVDCITEHVKPDILVFDDDYGTSRAPFISPEMWHEFFPGVWKKLVDHVHGKGVRFELHSCGYVTPLVGEFVDCGMDILQPLQTNNDLRYIKDTYGDRLVLRLAIFDKQMAALNQSEDQVRKDIRGYYEILAPGGNFLPDLVPIDDRYYELQREVQDEYEKELFGKK